MTTFGITNEGFTLKRLTDILQDMSNELSSVTDPVTGEQLTPDLEDENDPLVQVVNAFADALAEGWEQLQLAYNQFDPLKATGAGLSGLVQLNAIKRKGGTPTTVALALTGTPGMTVLGGKQVSDMAGNAVFNLPEFTFDEGGVAAVVGTSQEDGPLTALAGTIVKIVTPSAGWLTVTNPSDAVPGTLEETDTELRARQQLSTSATAQSVVGSIYSGIINLDGVTYCRVYQNITLEVDSRGIPAKSVAAVVTGGSHSDITDVIFNKLPAGCDTHGGVEVNKIDAQGVEYTIRYTEAVEVEIHCAVSVQVVNQAVWPSDGAARIKAAIVSFAQSGAAALNIASGFDRDGYVPGESVYASELFTPVNSVQGVRILSLKVGTTPAPAADFVTVDWDEIAAFDASRITVTVS